MPPVATGVPPGVGVPEGTPLVPEGTPLVPPGAGVAVPPVATGVPPGVGVPEGLPPVPTGASPEPEGFVPEGVVPGLFVSSPFFFLSRR